MSTCYKCGRELPGAQVECEDGCLNEPMGGIVQLSPEAMQQLTREQSDAWHEADLARELDTAKDAATRLANHLKEMGAANARIEIDLADGTYLIFIKKI